MYSMDYFSSLDMFLRSAVTEKIASYILIHFFIHLPSSPGILKQFLFVLVIKTAATKLLNNIHNFKNRLLKVILIYNFRDSKFQKNLHLTLKNIKVSLFKLFVFSRPFTASCLI